MDLKYVVYPGNVRSRNDNQLHHISARELMHLYDVDPRECIVYQEKFKNLGLNVDKLIPLRPRYNGNYELKAR